MNTTILFTMLGVLFILFGATLLKRKRITSVRCTKTALGTVKEVLEKPAKEGVNSLIFSPVVEFAVSGNTYSFEAAESTYKQDQYRPGDKYRLQYNPESPEEFKLVEKNTPYKVPLGILLLILGAISLSLSVNLSSKADSNVLYTKEFTYEDPSTGQLHGAVLEIKTTSEETLTVREDKMNDESADKYIYYRLSADGKPGDTITATITTEHNGTFLGLTVMPKVDGKWQKGVQFTTFVTEGSPNSLTKDYIITPDVTDLQITGSAHTNAFSSKKPGCMDIVFTIEMQGHTEIKQKDGSFGKLLITIFCGTMFLIILAGILAKINVYKERNKKNEQ